MSAKKDGGGSGGGAAAAAAGGGGGGGGGSKEEKKKRLEEEKKKKEEKERRKKEEEKQKEDEELKKKEEEEKRQQEEEEKKVQEEEAKRQKEEEATLLKEREEGEQLQQEAWERHQVRKELRSRNQSAADGRPEEAFFGRLDSSLKKNTAFVKKLRTLTEQQRDALSHDFSSLNLSKYIGEAVASVVEAKLKISDVGCAVHLCSLFHRRYADFAPLLLQAWKKHFEARREEKAPNVSKLRTDLRFIAELTVVGLFTDREGLSLIYEQLKNIIGADRETHTHVSVVISFCKHCGDDVAGLVPRKVRLAAERFGLAFPPSEIIGAEKQQPFQNLLREYFTSLAKHLKKDHRELQNIERQNRRILHSKGELSEDRHKQYEEFATSYQKLLANSQTLADLLDENMPELPPDKTVQEEHGPGIDIFTPGKPGDYDLEGGIWEDEDARNFYENLVDLKAFVPAILFKDNEKSVPGRDRDETRDGRETRDPAGAAEDLELELEALDIGDEPLELDGQDEADTEELAKKLLDEQEQEDEEASTGSHLKLIVDAFIQQLPNCVNRDLIDKAAMDFCMNMNTKSNRRKLVRALFTVPRQRLDLLPFYSRLVATLHPCMSDVAEDLCSMLKGDFRFHIRKKDQINIETKNKTVRFIGELAKFKIFSSCGSVGSPCGSGGSVGSPCGSGGSVGSPCGSGGSVGSPCGSGGSVGSPCGSGGSVGSPCGSGSSVGSPCGSVGSPCGSGGSVGSPCGSGGSVGSPCGSDGSVGSPCGSDGSVGSPCGSGGSVGSPCGSDGSVGSPCGSDGSVGSPCGSDGSVGSPCGSGGSVGSPCGSDGSVGSPCGSDGSVGSPCGSGGSVGSPCGSDGSVGSPCGSDGSVGSPCGSGGSVGSPCGSDGSVGSPCGSGALGRRWSLENRRVLCADAPGFCAGLAMEKDGRSSAMSEGEVLDEEEDDDEEEGGAETEEQSGNESEMNEQEEDDGSENEEEERDEEEEENTDYLTDSNKENETDEENNEVTIRGGGLKHVACAEDEDFIQALDKMMLENLQQRSGETVKVHQLDVAIPLQLKSQLRKGGSAPPSIGEGESDAADTMQFVMLTRKGNKQQYKILNVPLSSHLAANHFNQQQAEQEERLRMKKLTLDINERQEQEDYQEMMQSLAQRPAPANTNRERRPRYQHPKGAPNADLIFKTGGRRR
uniref:UPF2 regulator of nonsense mediated mRNA decay n=1 Tax=Salarias fasciatus TaxID=181472 RepID=A0A672HZX2_SALFA